MRYSCNNSERKPNPSFASVAVCRFDLRYSALHQQLGCKGCSRQWDHEYLRQQGLIK